MSKYQQVAHFNALIGNASPDDTAGLLEQAGIIHQELFKEMDDAIRDKNTKLLRDALVDTAITAYGMVYRCGGRTDNQTPTPTKRIKGDFWEKARSYADDLQGLYDLMMYQPLLDNRIFLATAAYELAILSEVFALDLGLPFDDDFKEINISNMSKFCISFEEALNTAQYWEEMGIQSEYKHTSDGLIAVVSRTDQHCKKGEHFPRGKLLKSVSYKKPVLKEVA